MKSLLSPVQKHHCQYLHWEQKGQHRADGPNQWDILRNQQKYASHDSRWRAKGLYDQRFVLHPNDTVALCVLVNRCRWTKRIQRSYLSEQQLYKLVPAFKITYPIVARIAFYTFIKFILVYKVQHLTEYIFAWIHILHFIGAKLNLKSIQIKKSKNACNALINS